MINFVLPNFYELNSLNYNLRSYLNHNPKHSNFVDIRFNGEEGSFPYFYWADNNLNNYPKEKILPRQEIETDVIKQQLIINCANSLLTPIDFIDCKINNLLSMLETGSNYILITLPGLLEYLKLKFPTYYFIGSTSFYKNDPDKKYLDDLKLIRLNYTDLNNPYYADIPKSKIDINIIKHCDNCNKWENCYNTDQKNRLLFMKQSSIQQCPLRQLICLDPEKIIELNQQGYQHFHLDINGETPVNKDYYINLYLKLFIKPEFQLVAKEKIHD